MKAEVSAYFDTAWQRACCLLIAALQYSYRGFPIIKGLKMNPIHYGPLFKDAQQKDP